ncbi:MAG: hypothetical protein J5529_10290 [Prevotella sp.]|jgi:hypothetical protein|nr:hypothetical protein [Prevotella sp.]
MLLLAPLVGSHAQQPTDSLKTELSDLPEATLPHGVVITATGDTLTEILLDDEDALLVKADSLVEDSFTGVAVKRLRRDWSTWRPDPKRALWLAIVLPGGGQIYNRKYWKLPIVYGGFVGCAYAMQWNNMMYRDYSQAYLDIMDDDPNTQSYNQFMHLGTTINSYNEDHYKNLFKKRKDYYRRYRDLSFFILIGVYALSVIDAYVDASLSDFDISKDLSMRVSPTIITTQAERNPLRSSGVGLQCSLNF